MTINDIKRQALIQSIARQAITQNKTSIADIIALLYENKTVLNTQDLLDCVSYIIDEIRKIRLNKLNY